MSRQKVSVYRDFIRSNVKEPDLETRKLSSEQILLLRYQCAVENKDFEAAKALKALITPADKKTEVSTAKRQAEQLFRKDKDHESHL